MDKKEKVKQYLKLSGYSDGQIEQSISNERYLNMLYGLLVEYERGISRLDPSIDSVDNYASSDKRRLK